MKHAWIKNILDKTLQYLSLYALIDGDEALPRLKNVGAPDSAPEKEKISDALLMIYKQEFKKTEVATLKERIKDIEEELQVLQEEIDREKDEKKKKELEEVLNFLVELIIKLDQQYKEFLYKKKREEAEKEGKRILAVTLIQLFSNLRNSKKFYSIELEPGINFKIEHKIIFGLQEDVVTEFLNCIINEIQFNEKRKDIVSKRVNEELNNLRIRHARPLDISSKRVKSIIAELHEETDKEIKADVYYRRAVASRNEVNTNQVKVSTNEVKVSTNQVKVSTNQVKVSTNQVKVSTNEVKARTNQVEINKTTQRTVDKIEIKQSEKTQNKKQAEPTSTPVISEFEKKEEQKKLEETKNILAGKQPETKQFKSESKRENRFGKKNGVTLFTEKNKKPPGPPGQDSQSEPTPPKNKPN